MMMYFNWKIPKVNTITHYCNRFQ